MRAWLPVLLVLASCAETAMPMAFSRNDILVPARADHHLLIDSVNLDEVQCVVYVRTTNGTVPAEETFLVGRREYAKLGVTHMDGSTEWLTPEEALGLAVSICEEADE